MQRHPQQLPQYLRSAARGLGPRRSRLIWSARQGYDGIIFDGVSIVCIQPSYGVALHSVMAAACHHERVHLHDVCAVCSTDGGLQAMLLHPSTKLVKGYIARLGPRGRLEEDASVRFAEGLRSAECPL